MSAHVVVAGPAYTRTITQVATNTVVDAFVSVGVKRGLVLETPYVGSDTNTYGVVGTADLIRVDAVTDAFTDGQKVYVTGAGVFTATATSNTIVGFANRAKAAVAGPLFVQLIPGISG